MPAKGGARPLRHAPWEAEQLGEHYAYELHMLRQIDDALQRWEECHPKDMPQGLSRTILRSMLEAGGLHSRQLLEFYEPTERPRRDDLHAIDYARSYDAPYAVELVRSGWSGVVGRTMAHLTTERGFGQVSATTLHIIRNEIEGAHKHFIECVDLPEHVRREILKWLLHYEAIDAAA